MRIKICGITTLEDAQKASCLGAWALGFNFYKSSARYVTPERAAEIIKALPSSILTIGIFVNASVCEINAIANLTGIQMVQLHGDEQANDYQNFPLPIIKALRLKAADELSVLNDWKFAYAILMDAYVKGTYGGTGQLAPWQLVTKISKNVRIILAGGISVRNIKLAIAQTQPYAIDMCSSVEKIPGSKSIEKMAAVFSTVRSGDRNE